MPSGLGRALRATVTGLMLLAALASMAAVPQTPQATAIVDLRVDPQDSLTLEVVGLENGYSFKHFPSGWGIKAHLELHNLGTDILIIPEGTRILTFPDQDVDVLAESELVLPAIGTTTGGYGSTPGLAAIAAHFDSSVLEEGLNKLLFQVDPDGLFEESDEGNNSGLLKLFHPAAYPDIVITEVEVNEVTVLGPLLSTYPAVIVRGKNIGADMVRRASVAVGLFTPTFSRHGSSISNYLLLEGGESFELIIDNLEVWLQFKSQPYLIEVRIQDDLAFQHATEWVEYLQIADFLPGTNCSRTAEFNCLSTPMERGSEDQLIGHWGQLSAALPNIRQELAAGIRHDSNRNAFSTTLSTTLVKPYPIYPTAGKTFLLGTFPPLQKSWNDCVDECIPEEIDTSTPDTNQLLATWKANWHDSVLRFRWLPNTGNPGNGSSFILEVSDSNGTVVHSINGNLNDEKHQLDATQVTNKSSMSPMLEWRHYSDIYNYRLSERGDSLEDAEATALKGFFVEYVYDGPPLLPGEYGWRVGFDSGNGLQDDSANWVQGPHFVLKADGLGPGDSPQLQQAHLQDTFIVRGEVIDASPAGLHVDTASGLVYVRTDADTHIYSSLTGKQENVPEGWNVLILSGIAPYILDRPYVPEDGDVFRGEVTDIRPGGFTVSTESGLVHMHVDANTVIHSAATGLQEEVPEGWEVYFLSQTSPYISGRAYVPVQQIPVATNVIEQVPTALEVNEFVTNRTHKRCTAVGETDAGTTAFSCHDGAYVELNESDIPNGTSAVLLVRHDPVVIYCTVTANPTPMQSTLVCPTGESITVENYFRIGTTVERLNDAAKLVSTATNLFDRMKKFESLANSQNDGHLSSQLSSYQVEASAGFSEAFEEAKANASPEILQLLEVMGDLTNKVTALADSFRSGSGRLIFDEHDVSSLIEQLQQFGGVYETIIDWMVLETLGDRPQEEQDNVKTDIQNLSEQFLPSMKSDLLQAATFLEQGNLGDAITILDKATANEELWEQQIAQPRINISLAGYTIDEAKEELLLYGDSLSQDAKGNLQSKIDALDSGLSLELQQLGTVNLTPLIEDLWATMRNAWESDGADNQHLIGLEGKALELISDAKSEIADYAEYMEEGVEDAIHANISVLLEALAGKDETRIQTAIDALVESLASSGSESQDEGESQDEERSQEELVKKAKDLMLAAETEITDYAEYMEEGVEDAIRSKISYLNQTLGRGDQSQIQDAINVLAEALASYGTEAQGEGLPQIGGLVAASDKTIDIAEGIIEDYKDSLDPELTAELQEKVKLLRDALEDADENQITGAFNDLTSLLNELTDYTPKVQPNIKIECSSQISVGTVLQCTSSHTQLPDQVTWSAPNGAPSSGSGEAFQTSFLTVGAFSISIEACIGSACATDVQTISVIPEPSPEDVPEDQAASN